MSPTTAMKCNFNWKAGHMEKDWYTKKRISTTLVEENEDKGAEEKSSTNEAHFYNL